MIKVPHYWGGAPLHAGVCHVVSRFIQFTFLCMTSSRDTARHSAGFGLMPFYNRVLVPLNGHGLTRKYASSDPET